MMNKKLFFSIGGFCGSLPIFGFGFKDSLTVFVIVLWPIQITFGWGDK